MDEDQAWQLLQGAKSVSVAKGKKVQTFDSVGSQKADVLKSVMGPSGNLRAPTYRVGEQFIVGYNLELYQDWVD